MKSRFRVMVAIALAVMVTSVSWSAGQMRSKPTPSHEVLPADLRYHLESADEGYFVLLDKVGIVNEPNWRERFSGQVLGFGIRTPRQTLTQDDVRHAVALLVDTTNWGTDAKACDLAGDAALILRGPAAEVTVMFELWCGRAHVRDETRRCLAAYGQIDAIAPAFRVLVRRYFADDEYLKGLE